MPYKEFKMVERDTFKYHLKKGHKTVHRGITSDLMRRENEHQSEFPGSKIVQIGRRTTREAAYKWEREGGKRPYRK
jgi:predicted GIY-YIG superfamily endonuclease